MTVFFDFDDTLFNTKRFSLAMVEAALVPCGVSWKEFLDGREQLRRIHSAGAQYYSLSEHLRILFRGDLDKALSAEESIYAFVREHAREFVFPDVIEFFTSNHSGRFLLATFGEERFQRAKVEGSGISPYLEELFFTDAVEKEEVICAFIETLDPHETFIFVEDKASVVLAVKRLCPRAHCVRIKRTDGRYLDDPTPENCHEISTLLELKELALTL